MNMHAVNSSNLLAVGYEGTTLYIRFNSGSVYAYYNVPNSIYSGLMRASSHGSYFHANIRGRYRDTKIG